jgi:hypothetical protein
LQKDVKLGKVGVVGGIAVKVLDSHGFEALERDPDTRLAGRESKPNVDILRVLHMLCGGKRDYGFLVVGTWSKGLIVLCYPIRR